MSDILCKCGGKIIDGFCDDCGKASGVQSVSNNNSIASNINTNVSITDVTNTSSFTIGSARTGSKRKNVTTSHVTSSKRHALGGGLVSLPSSPGIDPLKLILPKHEVPENKRYCPSCNSKVNRTKGYCPNCGKEYDFEPTLKEGQIINEKFEIKGPIALGGFGWIYLAWDKILSRWVILKGLLNAKDEAAASAAVSERQFLARVKHPNIVGIYDFIQHGKEGYIVMEYVGGRTLQSILNERNVLPVEEAVSYIMGILPAFAYLHSNGMVYCDFKPENVILENNDVKLIDMGAVRRIGDPDGDIYASKGFMAPEAADDPSPVSDLYTIGRTLAVLIMKFEYRKSYEFSLPSPTDQPTLSQNEALYIFLLRATHNDPAQRFQNADEMADQLYGVLREIVALKTKPVMFESRIFTADNLFDSEDIKGTEIAEIRLLPSIKINMFDIASNDLIQVATISDLNKQFSILKQLVDKYPQSFEARLRYCDVLINTGKFNNALEILNQLVLEDEFDWRPRWYMGKAYLSQGDYSLAKTEFGKVYFEMPGEIAPKLAIGFAEEMAQNIDSAISFYTRVAKVDPNNTTACFGLARCLCKKKDILGAATALELIQSNHSMYTQSRIIMAKVLMSDKSSITDSLLKKIANTIEFISSESSMVNQLVANLLTTAIDLIKEGILKENSDELLGCKMNIKDLSFGAEKAYRKMARFAQNKEEKAICIDSANRVRPVTFI